MNLVIQRYTREAGVRNLERNLAALARAAAVKVAEQEQVVPLNHDMQRLASPLIENGFAGGAEVEMEVLPMGVNNHEISNTFNISSPMVADEEMLEKVLGVIFFLNIHFTCLQLLVLYHETVICFSKAFESLQHFFLISIFDLRKRCPQSSGKH